MKKNRVLSINEFSKLISSFRRGGRVRKAEDGGKGEAERNPDYVYDEEEAEEAESRVPEDVQKQRRMRQFKAQQEYYKNRDRIVQPKEDQVRGGHSAYSDNYLPQVVVTPDYPYSVNMGSLPEIRVVGNTKYDTDEGYLPYESGYVEYSYPYTGPTFNGFTFHRKYGNRYIRLPNGDGIYYNSNYPSTDDEVKNYRLEYKPEEQEPYFMYEDFLPEGPLDVFPAIGRGIYRAYKRGWRPSFRLGGTLQKLKSGEKIMKGQNDIDTDDLSEDNYTVGDFVLDMLPIVGTARDAYRFAKDPNPENALMFAISAAGDVLTLVGGKVVATGLKASIKGGKAYVKSTKAAEAAKTAAKQSKTATKNIKRYFTGEELKKLEKVNKRAAARQYGKAGGHTKQANRIKKQLEANSDKINQAVKYSLGAYGSSRIGKAIIMGAHNGYNQYENIGSDAVESANQTIEDVNDTVNEHFKNNNSQASPAEKPSWKANAAKDITPTNGINYTVKAGDTLHEIAKAHGVSLDDIATLNPELKKSNGKWKVIRPGDKIQIYTGSQWADKNNIKFTMPEEDQDDIFL